MLQILLSRWIENLRTSFILRAHRILCSGVLHSWHVVLSFLLLKVSFGQALHFHFCVVAVRPVLLCFGDTHENVFRFLHENGKISIYCPSLGSGIDFHVRLVDTVSLPGQISFKNCMVAHFPSSCFLCFWKLFSNICTGALHVTLIKSLSFSGSISLSLNKGSDTRLAVSQVFVRIRLDIIYKGILQVIICSAYMGYFKKWL